MIPRVNADVAQVIDVHSAAGRRFVAGGVRSFVREQGTGPAVVLLHGVPRARFSTGRSSRGSPTRACARSPSTFPASASPTARGISTTRGRALRAGSGEAIDALGLDRCHLVVHDIGGPIGCEWAVANPERVLSLTALNTDLEPGHVPPAVDDAPVLDPRRGELWLRATPRTVFAALFRLQGLGDRAAMSTAEIYAYRELLLRARPRPRLPADHARLRAHGGEGPACWPRGWPAARIRHG